MSTLTTEMRTFVGQPGTIAVDGYMGFVIGQRYELSFLLRADNSVALRLTHPPYNKGVTWLYVKREQFRKWWVA